MMVALVMVALAMIAWMMVLHVMVALAMVLYVMLVGPVIKSYRVCNNTFAIIVLIVSGFGFLCCSIKLILQGIMHNKVLPFS